MNFDTKLKIGLVMIPLGTLAAGLICKAAEIDSTTSAAVGAFGTDASASAGGFITQHGGKFVLGSVIVSLFFLGWRLAKKMFSGR